MTLAILALTIINLVILKELKTEVKNLKMTLDEMKIEANKPKTV